MSTTTLLPPPIPASRAEISGKQTIDRVESELRALQRQPASRLRLPLDPKARRFGSEAALIQLLITWGLRQREPVLETYLSASAQDDAPEAARIRKLAESPFGLTALCMARDVVDKDQPEHGWTTESRGAVNEQLARFWQRNRNVDERQLGLWGPDETSWSEDNWPRRGPQVFFPVVDHHKYSRLPEFYFSSDEIRERGDFQSLADRVLRRLYDNSIDVNRGHRVAPFAPDLTQGLGAILHELFKNTHEWARHDATGAMRHRSVRGMLFQLHTDSVERLEQLAEGMPPLETFVRANPRSGSLRLLEISLFDSGPGLAARWLAKSGRWHEDLDCETELAACRACLEKGKTSSNRLDRGIGLHEVVTTLSELHGFLRLRTGKLSLYRDFTQSPFDPREDLAGHVLLDWTSQSTDLNEMARVEGTLYTMLLPA